MKENKEKRKKQDTLRERLEKEYNEFIHFLKCPVEYNTKRTNEEFKTNIRNRKHFLELQKLHEEGKFSIEDFKSLRIG